MKPDDLRRIIHGWPGVVEVPHFDRRSFKIGRGARQRTILTLAPDDASINLMFTPEEQAWKMATAPDIFTPVGGGWGRMGATMAPLSLLTEDDLTKAIDMICQRILGPRPRR